MLHVKPRPCHGATDDDDDDERELDMMMGIIQYLRSNVCRLIVGHNMVSTIIMLHEAVWKNQAYNYDDWAIICESAIIT